LFEAEAHAKQKPQRALFSYWFYLLFLLLSLLIYYCFCS